jgi:o-succinylbenzoate---CoA ligase
MSAAGWLRSLGLGRGDRIAIIGEHTPSCAALLQAAPLAGITVVLINHRLRPDERERQLARSVAKRTFGPEHEAIPDIFPSETGSCALEALSDEDPACVLFTSGTSGEAKAARLSWRAIRSACDHAIEHLSIDRRDRWIACLPLDHIGGASLIYRAGRCGYDLVLMPFSPAEVNARIDTGDITGLSLVPTMLHRLIAARAGAQWPSALRCLLVGGGPCSPELSAASAALGLHPSLTYGMTETASQLCTLLPAEAAAHPSSVGRVLPGMEVRIEPSGGDGNILVRGQHLFSGYEVNGTLIQPQRPDHWFATGDFGRMSHDGYLTVHCRRDDLILSGGENVYPAEVEAALSRHPAILEAAVGAIPDLEWGQRVVAVLVPRTAPCSDADLRTWCDLHLSRFKQPARWLWREALERNERGKIRRDLLAGYFT